MKTQRCFEREIWKIERRKMRRIAAIQLSQGEQSHKVVVQCRWGCMEMAKERMVRAKLTMVEAGDEEMAMCPEKASEEQELKAKFGVK